MVKSVTVRAPCSTANLGPGFDVFGLALDAFYDEVTVTKKPKSFGIKIVSSDDIPLDPNKNTAGLVAKNIKKDYRISDGLEISIKKNVPAGYGLGSSAASAAACTLAMMELYEYPTSSKRELVYYAGSGEKASAGTVHYDNVAASLFGKFVVVNPYYPCKDEIDFWELSAPRYLGCVVAIPKIKGPKQKTKMSRGLLPKNVKFSDAMKNLAYAVSIVGESSGDPSYGDARVFCENIVDQIVEPARKKIIPGFDKVKNGALRAGAHACTISGAGPSMIAFFDYDEEIGGNFDISKQIGAAMKRGFKSAKVDCDIVICKPSKGPIIKKRK